MARATPGHDEALGGPEGPSARDARRRVRGLWVLAGVIAGAGLLLCGAAGGKYAPMEGTGSPSFPALVALFALGEILVVHVEFRRDAHSFTLSEISLMIGLFLVDPVWMIVAQMVGAGIALLVNRQQSPLKCVFNLAQYLLTTSIAVVVFHALLPLDTTAGPESWPAAVAAMWVGSMVGTLCIFAAISWSEGEASLGRLASVMAFSSIVTWTNTAIGLLAVLVLVHEPTAVWLLAVPAVTLVFAYRAYTVQKQQQAGLRFLYESTRALNDAPDLEAAMVALLAQAREVFHVERAEMMFLPPDTSDPVLRTCVSGSGGHADATVMQHADPEVARAVREIVADAGPARLLRAKRRLQLVARTSSDVSRFLGPLRARDAMVTPLVGETSVIGAIVCADRMGDVGSFSREDMRLFETLANHVAVALEKGHLEQSLAHLRDLEKQLTHQVLHDPLTGLANRRLFRERMTDALAAGERPDGERSEVAVLYVDLDGFKSVNDTLGHDAGDQLLRAVAERLASCLRPSDTAARLGGDEFALLLPSVSDVDVALAVAARVLQALAVPVVLEGRAVYARASVGVAAALPGEVDYEELLRRGDAAMYAAKTNGKGRYELFSPRCVDPSPAPRDRIAPAVEPSRH